MLPPKLLTLNVVTLLPNIYINLYIYIDNNYKKYNQYHFHISL